MMPRGPGTARLFHERARQMCLALHGAHCPFREKVSVDAPPLDPRHSGQADRRGVERGVLEFSSGTATPLQTSSPAIARAPSAGNAGERPATNTAGATPGFSLIEVKVGERVIYRGSAWALVTTELFEMNFAFGWPYKVFVDGIEQVEPAEEGFFDGL